MRPTVASLILASISFLCGIAVWMIFPNLMMLFSKTEPRPNNAVKVLFVPGAAGWASAFLILAITNLTVGLRYRGWRVNLLLSILLLILLGILISAFMFFLTSSFGGISGIRA